MSSPADNADPWWQDICDMVGMYVVDEANIETHGLDLAASTNTLANHPDWTASYLARYQRMVLRDRNHPCVILWSLGNESGYGRVHDEMASWSRKNDPSRPVQYESCGGGQATDVICPMYARPELAKRLTQLDVQTAASSDPSRSWPAATHAPSSSRPVILCEYAHAMGNSVGNLDEYWEAFRETEGMQGGFIWDFVDQGLCQRPDGTMACKGDEQWHWSFGGHWGETSHDAQFCINGLFFPDRTPHPAAYECKKVMEPLKATLTKDGIQQLQAGAFEVQWEFCSYYHFIGLGHLSYMSWVEASGRLVSEQREGTCIDDQNTLQFSLAPEQLHLELFLSISVRLATSTSWGKAGHEVTMIQIPLDISALVEQQDVRAVPLQLAATQVIATTDHDRLTISTERYTAAFCLHTGVISSLSLVGEDSVVSIGGGPSLSLFRAPTDNDNGSMATVFDPLAVKWWIRVAVVLGTAIGLFPQSFASQWRSDGLDCLVQRAVKVEYCPTYQWGGLEVPAVSTELQTLKGTGPEVPCKLDYAFLQDQVVMVHSVDISSLSSVPRVGTVMTVPGKFDKLTYFGRSGESYCDRKQAGVVTMHSLSVADTHVDYIMPSENGNRHETRWVALQDSTGAGLAIAQCGSLFDFSCHHYTIGDLDAAQHAKDLRRRPEISVSVDHCQMGVGGDDSWSRSVHAQHLIQPGTYGWATRLIPLSVAGLGSDMLTVSSRVQAPLLCGEDLTALTTFIPAKGRNKLWKYSWFVVTLAVSSIVVFVKFQA